MTSTKNFTLFREGCEYTPTYRQDKLELAFAKFDGSCMKKRIHYIGGSEIERWYGQTEPIVLDDDIVDKFCRDIMFGKGEPKRQATVSLICLLDSENLLGGKDE